MRGDTRRSSFLVLVVLLSGAVLLAAGLFALWRGAGEAEARALREAESAAAAWASAARSRLADPAFLDRLPAAARFAVSGGALVRDEHEEAEFFLELPDELSLRRIVDEAIVVEQGRGRPEEAVALLERERQVPDRNPHLRGALATALAHVHLRRGDREAAAQALEDALELGAPRDEGLLLALAGAGLPLPEQAARVIASRPRKTATAFLDLLRERDARVAEDVSTRIEAVRERRRLEERVQTELPRLLGASERLHFALDGGIALWHPNGEASGVGAWVPPEVVAATLAGEAGADGSARLIVAADPPIGAYAAGPMLAVQPAPSPTTRRGGRTWLFASLLTLVALVFATALGLTLNAVRREASAARARADFLVSVTHELKTPLSSIRLLAEMLEDERVPSEARRGAYHALLSGEAARLSMLIENVLDIGRIERGERRLDLRPEPLDGVLMEAVSLFRPIAAREGIVLDVELDAEDAHGPADRAALVQVFLNLLDNARKHGREGGRIEVSSGRAAGSWFAIVRDHGPGVPADERETIFHRFSRGRASKVGAVPGVGLGLYLARAIVAEHGGTLAVDQSVSDARGAAFRVVLPEEPA